MDTIPAYAKQFEVNKSKGNLYILYAVSILFTLFGIGMVIAQMKNAYLFAGFAFFLFLVSVFGTVPWVKYFITPEGIFLKRYGKIFFFSFSDIDSISEVSEEKLEEFALTTRNKFALDHQNEMKSPPADIGSAVGLVLGALKDQVQQNKPLQFLSVPISYSGSKYSPVARSAKIPCDSVFIHLKDGKGYFISPKDVKAFVAEADKYFHK